ncbi:putative cytoplasmic protein [Salmonella enterica subsp. arizonae]|uniref:Putative cytoplasmic protein n=1 Tax=Salmonella enterica subsp. arizonae TaxID=59203 RepID=A0A379TG81_SALER|nr:putative cytoplasmic protein [Salmonella enterica subsp. arizonae]
MRIYYILSFFLSRLNLTRRLMPYFRHYCHLVQPFTLGSGDEFYLQVNDENYIVLLESGIASFCRNDNRLHISSTFAPSIVGMVDSYGATYNVRARPEHFLLRRNGLYR